MPKVLIDFRGYVFFFFSNEKGEPSHIHVSKGKPSANSAKFWIKREGIELVDNGARIPKSDLRDIYEYIYANKAAIVGMWMDFFGEGYMKN